MKYVKLVALFSTMVCCSFCKAQKKTERPPDTSKLETRDLVTLHGPKTSVRTIRQDRNGNLWLASNEGIIRYDGKYFTNITGNMTSDRYFSIVEDRKGNFWFATYGSGVYYYDGKSFQHFTTQQGLANNRVSTIYEDKTGKIWFGADGGVSRYDGKSFQNFPTNGGLVSNDVNSIIEDKTGKLWFGTRGYTYVYDGKTFTVFTSNGKPFENVWSILEDRKGNIWFGGGSGLSRYDGSILTNFTTNHVVYVYEDKKGNIWTSVASDNGNGFGLSRFDDKSLSNKPTVTEITQSLNVFGILEVNDGSIWFGAFDGVFRYDGNTITDFKNKEAQK